MAKYISALFLSLVLSAGHGQITSIKIEDLQEMMLTQDTELTIYNFWATWCGPCIKEMPYFDELAKEHENVKVYFISVDFKNQFERVEKFVADQKLYSPILFLDETDPDHFMPKVSSEWSGAIPASLFVNDLGRKKFYEQDFTRKELEEEVKKLLN